MKLVEQHGAEALEGGVARQHPREHALGHDLDARIAPDPRLEPHPVADRAADALAERRGHARRDRARREPSRLEHHDRAAAQPDRLEQRKRDDRALACTGRRDEHCIAALGERAAERG